MNLLIANRQRSRKIRPAELKKIIAATLADLGVEAADLEINLVGAVEMAALNETFLQHEGSTDVITFDYSETVEKADRRPGDRSLVQGEIFVCVDEALLQAKQFKVGWQSEVVRYAVHGVLHLLGYDDATVRLRRDMKREEDRLVAVLSSRFSLAKISGAP